MIEEIKLPAKFLYLSRTWELSFKTLEEIKLPAKFFLSLMYLKSIMQNEDKIQLSAKIYKYIRPITQNE